MQNNDIIEKLITLHGNDVLRIATAYTRNPTISEDIFQEVFIKVAKNIHKFKGESSERTWIIRITINTCKDYLKSAWNKKVISIEDAKEENKDNLFEENVINKEKSNNIIKEILGLPVKYKEVILLYYYQNFSTSEIAKILSIPEASVRTRMKRAREMLKEKLQIILEEEKGVWAFMTKKELKKLFDKELNNIRVSDELKEKTLKEINNIKSQNVFYIPYLRNVCAVFIVAFICFSVYYTNNQFFNKSFDKEEDNAIYNNMETENLKARTLGPETLNNTILKELNYDIEESVVDKRVEKNFVPQQTMLKTAPLLTEKLTSDATQIEVITENQMFFGDVMNDEVSLEGILEEEFLLRYPDAQKTSNGYKVLENGIEEIYIFKDGFLVKS